MANPIIVNAGESVGQGDWDALAAQHGGVKSSSARGATEAEMKAAGLGGDDDPGFQQRPIYRYYFNDGSFVEARTASNGADYQVVDYKPSARFTQDAANKPATAAATNAKPAGSKTQVEGTPTGQKDANGEEIRDNSRPVMITRKPDGSIFSQEPLTTAERQQWEREKNGGKTDAEVATAATTTPTESVNPSDPTRLRKPDGKGGWTDAGANQVEVDRRAKEKQAEVERNTPKDTPGTVTRNGKTYIQHTTPGVAGKPGEIYYTDQAGTRVSLPEETKGTTLKLPPGAPVFDASDPDKAMESYRALFQFIDPLVLSGQITREDGLAALSGPHEITGQLIAQRDSERRTNENLRRDQLTERSQDATVAGNRLSFSQNAANTAIKTSGDLVKAAEGGSSTIVPLMVLQSAMAQTNGGFREQPNISNRGGGMLPPVPGQPGGAVPPSAAPPDPSTVGQAPPMTAERAAGIMANPAFRPPPPVTGAVGMPGAPSAGAPVRDDYRTNPGTPPLNPAAGEPGNNPNAPVGLIPNQVMRSGMGAGSRNAEDLARQMIQEGEDPEMVYRVMQRAAQKYGGGTAVA